MKTTKKVIGSLEKCYSLAMLRYRGREHFLAAAEKVNSCFLYDLYGNYEETVWEGPGGVMTMAHIPGTDGQFLATQKFYSPNDSKEAFLAAVRPKEEGGFQIRRLAELPFIHRFDIISKNGVNYLIACTLKSGHDGKDDWTHPGRVYAGVLPKDLSEYGDGIPLPLSVLKNGMSRNHGCYRFEEGERKGSVISCEQGVFLFEVPERPEGKWEITQLLQEPSSDALLLDLNGDGEEELVTLSPFHGDTLRIYEKKNGAYTCAYTFPQPLPFLHAIFGGTIYGRPALIVGSRQGERLLLMLRWEKKGGYTYEILDRGCGAANVLHYTREGKEIIVAANRETDEIAMYELEP